MNISEVIKYPILTEKTYKQMPQNVYTFAVHPKTNRAEVKKAIEFIFAVKVGKVNIIKIDKKPKKLGKFKGFTNKIKKAIVFLEEGKINLYPDDNKTSKKNVQTTKKIIKGQTSKDKNMILDVEKRAAEKIAKNTEKTTKAKQEKKAQNLQSIKNNKKKVNKEKT